ncbi:MAG: hypothetical protein Q9197_003045 [Variospora fuerteventurae]
MKPMLRDRLLQRELGHLSKNTTVKGLYGDQSWVENLDIINELGGHSGCVNALSWSTSGRLLASGSDDQHLNIHSYQPDSSTAQFVLNTTVATGHSANIFSVKFMPHSNDRTIVTCAGDAEVRVFDIEDSGRSTIPSESSSSPTSGRRVRNMYKGVQYLSCGDTDARVYRSHADRVKRIVTESSPFLFLYVSLKHLLARFPSLRFASCVAKFYRAQTDVVFQESTATAADRVIVPAARMARYREIPLQSICAFAEAYKAHHLDLNTISCSATQPHYIALGGAHLHCFLHDRRMLGRDRQAERGSPGNVTPTGSMSSIENDCMGAATRTDNGHITACKISDANPNELIASWSGDQIYSFDILQSPDAGDADHQATDSPVERTSGVKVKETPDRKRKRKQVQASESSERERRSSRPRRSTSATSERGNLALRVRYENGQSEDVAMSESVARVSQAVTDEARQSVLSKSQKRSLQIAQSVVKIRKLLFSLSDTGVPSAPVVDDPSSHKSSFTSVLAFAGSIVPEMDEISRSWRYPLDPHAEEVLVQQTLRGHRDSSRRFVQAAGTLAKSLGGRLQTNSTESGALLHYLHYFQQIDPAPHEGPNPSPQEIFSFDFLKAIILWLDGGPQALLQGFKRPPNQRIDNPRFPIPEDADHAGIDNYLIPYLLRLAGSRPIPNVDASRFEKDEYRQVFPSESGAVIAFSSTIRMPLMDLSRAIMTAEAAETPVAQDQKAALRFWGFKVGRGLLMNAGEGINFQYVDVAFGGLGTARVDEGRAQEDIDPAEMEDVVDSVRLVTREPSGIGDSAPIHEAAISAVDEIGGAPAARSPSVSREASADFEDTGSDADVVLMDDLHDEIAEHMAEHAEHENGMHDDDDDDDEEDNNEQNEGDVENSDEDITAEERQFIFRSASDRGKSRETVEQGVPYSSHTRSYAGHCNVRTVKDANFFGLNDEYVVSGSDSGHLFIWDKKTSELVNILQGDGHPYEPVLAVSGIDSTIKIFSPDRRAQDDARAGVNIGSGSNGSAIHSSLSGARRRARRTSSNNGSGATEGLESRKRMDQRDQIIRENDVQRQGGMREAYITVRCDGPFQRLRMVEVDFAEWLSWF